MPELSPPTLETLSRCLTTAEVCSMLGISRVTLWRMRRAGLFPAPLSVSVGRVAWPFKDVLDWMASRPRVA